MENRRRTKGHDSDTGEVRKVSYDFQMINPITNLKQRFDSGQNDFNKKFSSTLSYSDKGSTIT